MNASSTVNRTAAASTMRNGGSSARRRRKTLAVQNDNAGISSSVDATFAYWAGAKANSCGQITPAPTANPNALCDGNGLTTTATTLKGASCLSATEVIAYQLHGGVHRFYGLSDGSSGIPQGAPIPLTTAPGTSSLPYNPALGATLGANTVDVCWAFFQGHSKH